MSNDQPVLDDERSEWTEDELDRALASLRSPAEPSEPALRRARTALLTEAVLTEAGLTEARLTDVSPMMATQVKRSVPPLMTNASDRRNKPRFRRPVLIAAVLLLLVAGG